MKRLSLTLLMAVVVIFSNAQAIKIATYNAKLSKNSSGLPQHDLGVLASTILEDEFGGAYVYFKMDVVNFKAVKAKYRLELVVMEVKDGKESVNFYNDLFIPTKNGWFYSFSQFNPGTYNVRIRDKDNETDVYCKATFVVTGRPKPDYKHNSTLIVCKSVDDNWNAVGQTTKFKQGECMNFLYKAKDRMNYGVLTWNVVRVKEDGTEEYVTHLNQNGGYNKPFRWLATTDGVCVFDKPGKYRCYLFDKNDFESRHDEDSKYLGKGEFSVE